MKFYSLFFIDDNRMVILSDEADLNKGYAELTKKGVPLVKSSHECDAEMMTKALVSIRMSQLVQEAKDGMPDFEQR